MMSITVILIYVFLTGDIHAFDANDTNILGVDIHGFVSQGYLNSSDNNYLANDSRGGTFHYNDVGINFSKQLTDRLRLGLQLFSHDLGDIGNNDVILDWAFADYRWKDWAGFRAGKIKFPFGFYGETRDVDALRTNVLLPQSVYSDYQRDTFFALQGIGIYGHVPVDAMGALSYQFQVGTFDIDTDSGTAKLVELVTYGMLEADDFDVDDAYVGSLQWHTPIEGLRVGGTIFCYSYKSDMKTTGMGPVPFPPGMSIEVDMEDVTTYVLSAEYTWQDLIVAAEYYNEDMDPEYFVLSSITSLESEGYYVSAAYRFTDWLELGTYYSVYYPNTDDKDGDSLENLGLPDHGAWLKDFALSTRFDLNDYIIFKLEGHVMDGTAMLIAADNAPYPTNQDWYLFAAKLSFSF